MAKIPNLYPPIGVNQWKGIPNNQYIPLTITPADCQKHFQLKLMSGVYI